MANLDQYPIDQNGEADGEWLMYHPNGNLWYRGNWIHGVRHGLDEAYFSDGRLKYRGYWNMDKKIKYWLTHKYYYLCLI